MRRLLILVWVLGGCGGTSAAQELGPTDVDRGEAREVQGSTLLHTRTPSPPFAFRLSIPHGSQVVLYQMTANGDLRSWVTPYERPERPTAVMRTDWSLWRAIHEDTPAPQQFFELRADGTLAYARSLDEARMVCAETSGGRMRCRCEGHTPVEDATFSILGRDVVATTPYATATVASVSPAPRTDAERLRVLIVLATFNLSVDDHGDSAHDVDY
jgi:hypothetical protein